jgi:hypothetical protein
MCRPNSQVRSLVTNRERSLGRGRGSKATQSREWLGAKYFLQIRKAEGPTIGVTEDRPKRVTSPAPSAPSQHSKQRDAAQPLALSTQRPIASSLIPGGSSIVRQLALQHCPELIGAAVEEDEIRCWPYR